LTGWNNGELDCDSFHLWKSCICQPAVDQTAGHSILRLDQRVDGLALLSPSNYESSLTYSVTAGDDGKPIEQKAFEIISHINMSANTKSTCANFVSTK
jgi:hypothetical protein